MLRRHSGSNDEDEASEKTSIAIETEKQYPSNASKTSDSSDCQKSTGSAAKNGVINQTNDSEEKVEMDTMGQPEWRRRRLRGPWRSSFLVIFITAASVFLLFSVINSFMTRHRDPVGCEQPWMRPIYGKYEGFDAEHTRFASKYGLHLYREGGMNEDFTVRFMFDVI